MYVQLMTLVRSILAVCTSSKIIYTEEKSIWMNLYVYISMYLYIRLCVFSILGAVVFERYRKSEQNFLFNNSVSTLSKQLCIKFAKTTLYQSWPNYIYALRCKLLLLQSKEITGLSTQMLFLGDYTCIHQSFHTFEHTYLCIKLNCAEVNVLHKISLCGCLPTQITSLDHI